DQLGTGSGSADGSDEPLDVVIVGAGPAGIGAALALQARGLRFAVLEREQPFATIQNFPKSKLIFSEPREIQTGSSLWFEDAVKEDLVDRWEQALDDQSLPIRQPEEVVNIERDGDGFIVHSKAGDDKQTTRCRRVLLAIGRRGSVRKLGVPGEDGDQVTYSLKDPADYDGKRLLVVGGGDSAVEAAVACAEAGAEVTVSYRGNEFSRVKAGNRERIDAAAQSGTVRLEMGTVATEIREGAVALKRGEEELEVPADAVLVLIGTTLPHGFLKRVGLRMAGQMDVLRALWIAAFAAMTYAFYVLKAKRDLFPFGPGHPFDGAHEFFQVDLGWRTVDAGFWGTCIYALIIVGFGIRAYQKYPRPEQKRRYVSLILFQCVFLFGIPEILGPLVIHLGESVPEILARPWKFYAVSVPWPLSIWSVIEGPGWGGVAPATNALWILIGLLVAFVAVPLYVRSQGQRFCSYLCGCGGLAETLGDQWRHLAPRGEDSHRAEWFGRAVLFLAVPVTLLILNDAWQFFASGALHDTAQFAQQWYGLMVDFWLASVVGVALYPYLGNRVWCRFFCPLRAWMEILSKRISRITIKSNDKCIGCGECTRYCQMGIQVQKFAQQKRDMDNGNSACIQCGICIQVCPMEVLSVGDRDLKKTDPRPVGPEPVPR
ncbi:MAG: NAD(P)-binding domain-containing protein, partial [Gemmatimonadetes bacterium]|nr:NAD(P)-binding domain-containing protein [Gemmatimonadota bacterium]